MTKHYQRFMYMAILQSILLLTFLLSMILLYQISVVTISVIIILLIGIGMNIILYLYFRKIATLKKE
ncbi:hypothetical protein SAMN04488134_101632 [Amphibacillus marinus]|uniref:Uncharacterized protein n=1 Tax=Amphibacillus marinus TaxID=872970 RepID=A0A1H8IJA1_9BACI|nr:hypothetical protein [Amphibacillus marinus]SEN68431.1 hypothetical protein SAMN04488134_101632 [Amphibacillus marinus]